MKRKQRHLDWLWMGAHQFRTVDARLTAHHWECSERTAARELDGLVAEKELHRGTALMCCVPPVDGPLAVCEPGEPFRHGGISKRCRRRWAALPCSERAYYYLSPGAAKSYGVEKPKVDRTKVSHDIGVAAVCFHIAREGERSKHLRGEDPVLHLFSQHRMKRPDLVFLDEKGAATAVAEYATSYDSNRVRDLIHFCHLMHFSIEVF